MQCLTEGFEVLGLGFGERDNTDDRQGDLEVAAVLDEFGDVVVGGEYTDLRAVDDRWVRVDRELTERSAPHAEPDRRAEDGLVGAVRHTHRIGVVGEFGAVFVLRAPGQ